MQNLPLPMKRNLFLAQQVNQETINNISSKIIEINENDIYLKTLYSSFGITYNPENIKLYIDSFGGSVYQCFGLIGIIKASTTKVDTYTTGVAMSCGFLISIVGNKRYCYSTSTFLYHQVWSQFSGKVCDLELELTQVKLLQSKIEELTLLHTKINKSMLKKNYKHKKDWFINAEEALDLGIIDEII